MTPLIRDEFNLNDKARAAAIAAAAGGEVGGSNWETQSESGVSESSAASSNAALRLAALKQGLVNLPKPQFEYDFDVPDFEEEEDAAKRVTDAEEEELLKHRLRIEDS